MSDLRETFEKFWALIRASQLYGGPPRSADSAAALSIAQDALRLATDAQDEDLLLDAWAMMAYTLNADEQWGEAISYYERALQRRESRGDSMAMARLRIGYMAALIHSGRYDEALKTAHAAEAAFKEAGDHFRLARLYTNIGGVYHRLDQHQKSIDYFITAANTFESIGDRESAAAVHHDLGNALARVDRFEEAEDMFERTCQTARDVGNHDLLASATYNQAYFFFLRGRYSEALKAFAQLRTQFKESGSVRHYALCDLDEAEIYLQLNISQDAATLAQSANRQFKQLGMNYEAAKALGFYGVALLQMRRYAEALETFRDAQQGFEREKNEYWIAALDLYRADVHLALGRYWEAQSLATQAKNRFEALGIPSSRMLSLVLLGRVALARKDLAAAERYRGEIEEITKNASVPLLLFPYHLLCGQIAEVNKNWPAAKTAYELAAQDLEMHQARLQQDDLRVTFLHGRNQVYESLVKLSLEDGSAGLNSAYSWCERSKSRGLVELLSHHLPSVNPHGEQSLLRRVHRLREELNLHYVRSKPEAHAGSMPDFEGVVIKEKELARTLREVALNDPEYVSLQQVSSAGIEAVQQFIPKDTTLVEYFITHEELLAFVISSGTAKVFRKLAPPSRIQTLQQKLAFQLEKFLLGPDYVQAHTTQILEATNHYLQALYEVLVHPLIDDIQTPHITIVPHGLLHFLPFHAFFDGQSYLLDRFEISYAPSASVLRYCLEKPDVAGASPLILGVADEMAPMVDQEVEALAEVFPEARTLSGDAATRSAFAGAAQAASFIHVATHATFRQDNPMFSSFKLSDGYVTALDLFSMTCQTNLVALSSCKSGMSEVSGSDDQLGLMRGFLYAGARSLLISLWSVSDDSTVALMTTFYKEWRAGSSKAKSLQTAMKTVRETYPNPFFWAPFILVGKV
jgi:CHAT domain-containing protein/tetratricopeptide (TPR) repeat protein